MRAMTTSSLILLTAIVFGGCARTKHYGEFYQQVSPQATTWEDPWLVPPVGPPRVINVGQPDQGAFQMFEQGYVMIGVSSFTDGPNLPDEYARRQAAKVGAEVVVISKNYSHTTTRTALVPTYQPGPTTTVGVATRYGNTWVYSDYTVGSAGTIGLAALPYTQTLWSYAATFWAKPVGTIGGLLLDDLTLQQRREAQTNRGAAVYAVVKGSPAHQADILPGDIIRTIAGQRIENNADAMRIVREQAGKQVRVEVSRLRIDGDKTDRIEVVAEVALNPIPQPRALTPATDVPVRDQ
jgi:membrane-associated protease RseP (regulator of RpoE activity)